MDSFEIEPRDSGYILRPLMRAQQRILFSQVVSYVLGVCCAIVAVGAVLLPALTGEGAPTSLRIGAAGLCGAAAAYLLWFASRGICSEVQIDFETQTITAQVPHRLGAPTQLVSYPFSKFKGVSRHASEVAGQDALTLKTKDGDEELWLARAKTAHIAALQSRLEVDLFRRL